jgi:hypothetical protein
MAYSAQVRGAFSCYSLSRETTAVERAEGGFRIRTFSRVRKLLPEGMGSSSRPFGLSSNPYVRRLGVSGYGRESGRVGELDILARAGLPIPEGVLLTRQAHHEFLVAGGLLQAIRGLARGGQVDHYQRALRMQFGYRSSPIEGKLNRAICNALIELGAPVVVVLSEDLAKSSLKSIPEVQDAIREAWLSLEGLKRQIEAAAHGEEPPRWPVLIQREIRPEYTGWSMTAEVPHEELVGEGKQSSSGKKVALYDVGPGTGGVASSTRKSIAHLALEAESSLGEPLRLEWGMVDGCWYMLSASPRKA